MSRLDDVYARLQSLVVGGRIDLAAAGEAFPSLLRPVLLLFKFPSPYWLTLGTLTRTSQVVLVAEGTFRLPGVESDPVAVSVTLTCEERDTADGLSFELAMRIAEPWTFDRSFPTLGPYEAQSDEAGGVMEWRPSFLKGMRVIDATIRGSTANGSLNMSGKLPVPTGGPLARYKTWLDGSWPLQLDGPVVLPATGADYPEFSLRAVASAASFTAGPLRLHDAGFRLLAVAQVDEAVFGVSAFSRLDVGGSLDMGGNPPVRAEIFSPVGFSSRVWRMMVEFDRSKGSAGAAIDSVGQMLQLGGDSLTPPPGLAGFAGFGLKSVDAWVGLGEDGLPTGLEAFSFDIGQDAGAAEWRPPVPFVTVRNLGTSWTVVWIPIEDQVEPAISGSVYGTMSIAGKDLDLIATIPDYQISASLSADTPIAIGDAFRSFFGNPGPPTPNGMVITELNVGADLLEQSFDADARIDMDWNLGVVSLIGLAFEIRASQSAVNGALSGRIRIGSRETSPTLAARAEYSGGESRSWTFAGRLEEGRKVSLVELTADLLGTSAPDLALDVTRLEGQITTGGPDDGTWSFAAAVSTAFHFTLLGSGFDLKAGVGVALAKADKTKPAQGTLSAFLKVNRLDIQISRDIGKPDPAYAIRIQFARLWLQASVVWVDDQPRGRRQLLTVQLGGMTLGEILEELVDLAAPTLGFKLDPPWDVLNRIDLSRFTLKVDLKAPRIVSLSYTVDADLIFMHLDALTISYTMGSGSSVELSLSGSFLGLTLDKPLAWDVVRDPPPAIPGKGVKLFELRYLGFGQHVSLSRNPDTVRETVDLLAKEMKPPEGDSNPLGAGSLIRFDSGSQWLIGFDLTILETVDLAVIFNDPRLYGLSIGLRGKNAGALAGLRFEVLYKKISDDVGMFRVELQLPEAFRHVELGAVSVTLGIIVVEIYTNGNFLIDLGFPHNRDYARAFTVQMAPFIGRGGIYFGLLDGTTSRRVPKILGGTFSPVIELGVGLAVGVGKEISFGPLSGGAYLQVEVIFEGVLAWYHPAGGGGTSLYYRVQGIAAIHGKIYGEVDFKVVKASATIEAYAEISVTFEAYRATLFRFTASVDVEAEVTILLITVSFSFNADISIDVTAGSDSEPPWTLAGPGTGNVPALPPPVHRPARIAALQEAQRDIRFAWNENLVVLAQAPVPVPIGVVPVFTIADPPLVWPGQAPDDGGGDDGEPKYRLAMMAFADNGVAPEARTAEHAALTAEEDGERPAAVLVEALLRWAFSSVIGGSQPGMLSAGEIDALSRELARPGTGSEPSVADTAFALTVFRPGAAPLPGPLSNFLAGNVRFEFGAGSTTPRGAMVVAMPPFVTLSVKFGEVAKATVDLASHNKVGSGYEKAAAARVTQFSPTPGPPGYWPADDPARYESFATLMFRDWCLMITRAAVRESKRALRDVAVAAVAGKTLDALASDNLPRDSLGYTVRVGDTPASVADYVGAGLAELEALNPGLEAALQAKNPGETMVLTIGVTGAGLVLANPNAPVVKDAPFQLKGVETQIRSTDSSLPVLARRLMGPNGKAEDLVAAAKLEADAHLLRPGAPFIVRERDDPVAGADALTTAAILYVRLYSDTHVPDADWYAQAIADDNPDLPVEGRPLPASVQVRPAPHSNAATIPYATRPGDTLLRIGAALSLMRNPDGYAAPEWKAFRKSVGTVSGVVQVPATQTLVQPGETLGMLALRLIAGTGTVAALLPWIAKADLLQPLALVRIETLAVTAADGATLRSIAEDHGMTMAQLAGQAGITANPGLFAAATSFTAPPLPAQTVDKLVAAALDGPGLSAISAEASRQMLGGLRLPAVVGDVGEPVAAGEALVALAELTGQQLAAPPLAGGASLTAIVTRNAAAPAWVAASVGPVTQTWTSAELAGHYPATSLAVAPEAPTPQALQLAGLSPRTYGLDHRIELQSAVDYGLAAITGPARLGNASLWPFPAALLAKARRSSATRFELVRAAPGTTVADHDALADTTFATLVALTIRRIPGYTHIYQMLGPQGPDRDLLLELARAIGEEDPAAATKVFIAVAPAPDAGNPHGLAILDSAAAQTFVIRANLATDLPTAAAPSTLHAFLDQPAAFLRLLWEASAAEGGFHFHFATRTGEDLPAGIFDGQGSAQLRIVAIDGRQQGAATGGRSLLAYNNCAFVGPGFDAAAHSLYAEAAVPITDPAELVPQALVPPGSAGIELRMPRAFPPAAGDPHAAEARLAGLYSLLRFSIGGAYPTGEAPPVAPRADDGLLLPNWERARLRRRVRRLGLRTGRDAPVTLWRYEQVVNLAKFGPASVAPAAAGLPPPDRDPYRGYGSAEVQRPPFSLAFGDLLGNSTRDPAAPKTPKTVPVELGYTDLLIGVAAWPAATMSYLPSPDGSKVRLTITLGAQPGAAVPGAADLPETARKAAKQQSERYSEIWFQLAQPTLSAYLLTSLAPDPDGSPRRLSLDEGTAPLRRFAASSYLYASAASALIAAPVQSGISLGALLSSRGLGAAAIARANADIALPALFAAGQMLRGDSYATFMEGQSADDIVAAAPGATRPADGAALLVIGSNAALPLRPWTVLALQGSRNIALGATSPTPPLATLASENRTTPAQLAIDNRANAVLQPPFEFRQGNLIVTVGDGIQSFDQVRSAFADHGEDVSIAELADGAAGEPGLFEPSAILQLANLVAVPPERPSGQGPAPQPPTLASMATLDSLASLAAANAGKPNLFAAGAQVSLGPWTPVAVPSTDETLGAFAARHYLSPAQLIEANADLTLGARTALVLPGAAALPADLSSIHLPYAARTDDTLGGLAPLFETTAEALARAVEAMPGTLVPEQDVTVTIHGAGVTDRTQAGDSFHSLLLRLQAKNSAVGLAELVAATADRPLLAEGALLVVPPPKLRPKTGPVPTAMTAAQVEEAYGADPVAFAAANAATVDLLAPSVTLSLARADGSLASVPTAARDTLNALLARLAGDGAVGSLKDLIDGNPDAALYLSGARTLLPPLPATVSASIGDGKGPFPSPAFPLTVTLRLQRSWRAVHSAFHVGPAEADGEGAAERADCAVPAPASSAPGGSTLTRDAFAAACLATLPDLRLATGRVDGVQADLWAVDFGCRGIKSVTVAPKVDYGNKVHDARFFALRPLYKALIGPEAQVRAVKSDGTLDTAVKRVFHGVDAEIWARRLLADLDLYLSAPYAAGILLAPDPGPAALDRLLKAKWTLAKAIAAGLGPVLAVPGETPDKGRAEAQAVVRAQCAASLSRAYSVATVVQYDDTVVSSYIPPAPVPGQPPPPPPPLPARLTGSARPKGEAARTAHFTVSNGRTSLAARDGFTTFLVGVPDPANHALIDTELAYVFDTLEFDIDSVAGVDGYEDLDRLTFLPPLAGDFRPTLVVTDLGPSSIPVPLRTHPAVPVLVSQAAQPSCPGTDDLTKVADWTFSLTYAHEHAEQDEVEVDVAFNIAPLVADFAAGEDKLAPALAAYAAVAEDLGRLMSWYVSPPDGEPETGVAKVRSHAASSLADLVEPVAAAWIDHWPPSGRKDSADDAPAGTSFRYHLTVDRSEDEGQTYITSLTVAPVQTSPGPGGRWPELTLVMPDGTEIPFLPKSAGSPVYKPQLPDGERVAAPDWPSFRLSFAGLNVAAWQNARGSMLVRRNPVLRTGTPTDDSFILTTARISAPDLITPFLVADQPLSLPAAEPVVALKDAFAKLFGGATGMPLTVGISYSYWIVRPVPPDDGLSADLPVALYPGHRLDNETAGTIADAIAAWRAAHQPVADGGRWSFSLTLHSSLAGESDPRPLLRIERVVLPIAIP